MSLTLDELADYVHHLRARVAELDAQVLAMIQRAKQAERERDESLQERDALIENLHDTQGISERAERAESALTALRARLEKVPTHHQLSAPDDRYLLLVDLQAALSLEEKT